MSTVLPGPEAASLPTVARIVARAVGQPLTPCAFVPLPGGRTGLGLWRVRLEAPWVAGVLSLVAKVVLVDDRESHLLRWLMSRGRLAPRLYQELPLSARLKVLLLEDVGDCGLPVDWPKQPRVADAVVEWLSRIARLAVPDPLTTTWTDWYRRTTLVREFETAWATIRALQAATPGFIEADEFRLLATLFAGRAIIAQRLQPVCRRFIHGDLEPDHLRAVGEIAIQVRAVDWGLGACGPLAFDLYDLVWGLPDSHFGQSLENLVCLMPSDVRPELTAPVLRLAGGVKAFLHAGRAAAEYLQAPAASGSAATSLGSLRTAVGRLHRWADHFPRGSDLR
ncbi:MAG: hypothetical protein M5U01_42235 [Ardenticatenaceae bacterium]|nr:hypothetical protein [Ardenticatenaceae bacterium]HBY94543.1 hypothetical protein [Chloroflexota bacterium]